MQPNGQRKNGERRASNSSVKNCVFFVCKRYGLFWQGWTKSLMNKHWHVKNTYTKALGKRACATLSAKKRSFCREEAAFFYSNKRGTIV